MYTSQAVQYHNDGFPPEQLDYEELLYPLLRAADALARYDQMLKGLHNSELLLAPLRNQEAVFSSRMEGTISTMDEILQYDAESNGEERVPEMRSEVLETILYRRTLITAQEDLKEGRPFGMHLIQRMHQQLLSFGRGADKAPGQFKVEQNYLADKPKQRILFVPIAPEHLRGGLERLFEYIHADTHPPLLRAGVMHLEFEALHPFKDGNGRIGRMLITLFMWRMGLISAPHFYMSGYFDEHKDEYIDTMREVSRTGRWEVWCDFFLRAVEDRALKNIATAERIKALYDDMKVVFADTLGSKWSMKALDYVFTNPVFRNSQFMRKSGIPPPSARRFTRVLAERHIIKTLIPGSGRRAALYSFEPLMELVRI
jgi:Fic family protein